MCSRVIQLPLTLKELSSLFQLLSRLFNITNTLIQRKHQTWKTANIWKCRLERKIAVFYKSATALSSLQPSIQYMYPLRNNIAPLPTKTNFRWIVYCSKVLLATRGEAEDKCESSGEIEYNESVKLITSLATHAATMTEALNATKLGLKVYRKLESDELPLTCMQFAPACVIKTFFKLDQIQACVIQIPALLLTALRTTSLVAQMYFVQLRSECDL